MRRMLVAAALAAAVLGTGAAVAPAATPPGDPPGGMRIDRFAGDDRYATAVAVNRAVFPSDQNTSTTNAYFAILASGEPDRWADALVGSALAGDLAREDCSDATGFTGFTSPKERDERVGDYFDTDDESDALTPMPPPSPGDWNGIPLFAADACGAPLLLTRRDAIPPIVVDALRDWRPRVVVILGGEAAVTREVEARIKGEIGIPQVVRIAGADRYATAAAVAECIDATNSCLSDVDLTFEVDDLGRFPRPSSLNPWAHCATQPASFPLLVTVPTCALTTAFMATGEAFADALAAGGMAFANVTPILLTRSGQLPDPTRVALLDLGVEGVIVLGGTAAVSSAVEAAVDGLASPLGGTITLARVAGADRYATAAELADLADSEAAFHFGAPLPNPSRVGQAGCDTGGTVLGYDLPLACPLVELAVPDPTGGGRFRFGSTFMGFDTDTVVIARGDDFPDALVGSILAGAFEYAMVLTDGGPDATSLSPAAAEFLGSVSRSVIQLDVLGGPSAIPAAVIGG